jgi:hypothetical protein
VNATTRKRTQPLSVFTPSKGKARRLQLVITGVTVTTVERGVQTDGVLYTKSLTIDKEQGLKIITVKREEIHCDSRNAFLCIFSVLFKTLLVTWLMQDACL